MSVDLQVVFPQEQIPLSSIRLATGTTNLLDITGQNFESTESVLINQVESQNFIVLSRTKLLAEIPDVVLNDRITDIIVLARQLALTRRSLLKFTLTKNPQMVTGLMKMVQLFLILLLNTKGTDKFEKRRGASALVNIGQSFGAAESQGVVGDFVIAVDTASRQMVGMQGRNQTIPRDERLLIAKVVQARFNKELGALIVSVELTSMAGRAAVANLEV